jgi:hypothetical protein
LANLGISVQREQRLEQDRFELGFGADLVKPFNDWFSVSLGLGAVLYQTDAELDSVEQVNCPPCGFAAPQTNRVADDIDAFDVGGMTRLRAQFRAMPNLSIVASAHYTFAEPTAVIGNQDSGDDLLAGMRTHTGIKKTDAFGFNLSVNLLLH